MNEWQRSVRFLASELLRCVHSDDPREAEEIAGQIKRRIELELDVCGTCGETFRVREGECCPEPASRDDWAEEVERAHLEERAQQAGGPFGLPHMGRF